SAEGSRLRIVVDLHIKILCDLPPAPLQLQAEIVVLSADAPLPANVVEDFPANESKLRDVVAQTGIPVAPPSRIDEEGIPLQFHSSPGYSGLAAVADDVDARPGDDIETRG